MSEQAKPTHLERLRALGYRVWHDGTQWRASGPRELMAPSLAALRKAVEA